MVDILKLLKEGVSEEDIVEDFFDALDDARVEYEKWQEEEKRKAALMEQKKLEEEYAKKKRAKAREALGAAIIEYFSTLDVTIDEETYKNMDLIIDALPKIKVVRSNFGGWF